MINLTEKLDTIAENVPKVYEQGKTDEHTRFMSSFQQQGKRTGYTYGFYYWSDDILYPVYDIILSGSNSNIFFGSTVEGDLKQRFKDCGITFDTSKATQLNGMFQACYKLTVAPDVDASSTPTINSLFYNCITLIEATIKNLQPTTTALNTFFQCKRLILLNISGSIGKSIDLKYSPLDLESAKSVITHLVDYDGTDDVYVYSVTFSDTTWAYLDADEGITHNGTHYSWRDFISRLGWEA